MKKFAYFAASFFFLTILVMFIFGNPAAIAQDGPFFPPDNLRESQPAPWPSEPGAMPALIGGEKADRPMVFSRPVETTPQSVTATNIDVWYGETQKFGYNGNPQQWVNIVGNVSAPAGVKTLEYSLDSGATWKPLTVGPGDPINMRLALRAVNPVQGNFNIEIDYADLADSANILEIRATDNNNDVTTKQVTIDYSAGNTWPLPYTANWGSGMDLQDIAQVVDGDWEIQGNKLIPLDIGYDRLVAIGDETWDEYEVTAAVTVKQLDESGWVGSSNGPSVGFIMRWQGHNQTPAPAPTEQPRLDWERTGALGWYRWAQKNGSEGLELRSKNVWIGTNTAKVWDFGVPYFLKMSVQNAPGANGGQAYYRLKFWRQEDNEPAKWDIEGFSAEADSPVGSLLLVAHHVDVEFGLVQINDLSTPLSLTTNVNGQGDIVTNPPAQSQFSYGERVLIYPIADEGYIFDGWSGDIIGNEDPLVVYMTKDLNITANFVEPVAGSLDVTVVGEGTVTKDPDMAEYTGGEIVNLIANPMEGYKFKEWSGDLSGSQNPAAIKISGNKSVLATFEKTDRDAPYSDNFAQCDLDENLWTIVNPTGDGSISMTGSTLQLNLPAGDPHTMWADNRDAIRVMQDMSNQDFLVEVKFDTIPAQRFQIAGVLVEQDEDNWLRFDFFHNGSGVIIFAGGTIGGSPIIESSLPIALNGSTELYMRVNRANNVWTQSYSVDGSTWKIAESFNRILTVNGIGVFSGNEPSQLGASAPAFTALIDYFRNISYPDGGNYTIDVDSNGQGEVKVTPEGNAYTCGQEVEIEAIPDSGWSFQDWSGDITGNSNPVRVTMDANKNITANFNFVTVPDSDVLIFLPGIMKP